MTKILEPGTGLVHYDGPAQMGNVTLCGITDWIGRERGRPTRRKVTCLGCRSIAEHVSDHLFDKLLPELGEANEHGAVEYIVRFLKGASL